MTRDCYSYTVGVLYTAGDSFAERRSELLVGPILLTGARYIRFTTSGINNGYQGLECETYSCGAWRKITGGRPDAILDLSEPRASRTEQELELLAKTPHTVRIDYDRFELLELIANEADFNNWVCESFSIDNFKGILVASQSWNCIVLKRRKRNASMPPLVIEYRDRRWYVTGPQGLVRKSSKGFIEPELKKYLAPYLNNDYFVQRRIRSLTDDGQSLILHLQIHQRRDGAWKTPSLYGVKAVNSFFAALTAGGEFLPSPLWGEETCLGIGEREAASLRLKVQRLVVAAARRIEELIGGPLGVLGFHVLLEGTEPRIVAVDPRPSAPRRPARYLEIYRHLAELSLSLCDSGKKSEINLLKFNRQKHQTKLAPSSNGISLWNRVSKNEISSLLKSRFDWIDMSLGHGGRALLAELAKIDIEKRPFFSLRIGNALSDLTADDKYEFANIVSIEDYLGKGLLKWPEATYMRSLRVPLLLSQLSQSLSALKGNAPDLLWLEHPDLALLGIPEKLLLDELKTTVQWFEEMCQLGIANNWGVYLFNSSSGRSQKLMSTIIQLAGQKSHLSSVATRAYRSNLKVIDSIQSFKLASFVSVSSITVEDVAQAKAAGATLLKQWSNVSLNNIGKK